MHIHVNIQICQILYILSWREYVLLFHCFTVHNSIYNKHKFLYLVLSHYLLCALAFTWLTESSSLYNIFRTNNYICLVAVIPLYTKTVFIIYLFYFETHTRAFDRRWLHYPQHRMLVLKANQAYFITISSKQSDFCKSATKISL